MCHAYTNVIKLDIALIYTSVKNINIGSRYTSVEKIDIVPIYMSVKIKTLLSNRKTYSEFTLVSCR